MKTIEVTVRRVTFTTYEVQVGDDFDLDRRGAFSDLEDDYFENPFDWTEVYDEVSVWEVDSAEEAQPVK